jgi:hypothetical protein
MWLIYSIVAKVRLFRPDSTKRINDSLKPFRDEFLMGKALDSWFSDSLVEQSAG